jgi:putative glutamine amidotransferase
LNPTIRQKSALVAVTPTIDLHPDGERIGLNRAYVSALEGAGIVPYITPPLRDAARAGELLEMASGLVLTGGVDIDPAMYGEKPHERTESPLQIRDQWEAALTDAAKEMGIPTLAICRGMQLVNVCMGGTLIQDIPSSPHFMPHDVDERDCRSHEIDVDPDSRLGRILGRERIAVNTMHHQGIKDVAGQLCVTARAADGMIEALEWPGDDWWMLAVQWHPEELTDDPEPWDRKIFGAFAAQVRTHNAKSRQGPVIVS